MQLEDCVPGELVRYGADMEIARVEEYWVVKSRKKHLVNMKGEKVYLASWVEIEPVGEIRAAEVVDALINMAQLVREAKSILKIDLEEGWR